MLLLGVVTLCSAQPVDLFEDGFEGLVFPPTDWIMNGVAWVSATTTTIPDVEPTEPYEGDYCAGMSSDPGNYMISPLKNNPGAYYFFVHKKDTGNHQFVVEFQVEDGVTPGAQIGETWNFVGEYWAENGWQPSTIDLTGYAPGYIRIRPSPPAPGPLKYMYFDKYNPDTVPVELSSFTANIVHQNDQDMVQLNWTTQSETQASGFYIFRNQNMDLANALQLNTSLIEATNSSTSTNYSFVDNEIQPGTLYYWLQSNDMSGSTQLFGPISIIIDANDQTTTGTGIASRLNDIYPNPFNLKAVIPIQLTSKGDIKLEIFNQKGQLVWTYIKDSAEGGLYKIDWNGRDMNGRLLSSGVYLCRMTSDNYMSTKKLVLQK